MRDRMLAAVLVAVGLVLLVAAPIVWRLGSSTPARGDVAGVEQALRSAAGSEESAPVPSPSVTTTVATPSQMSATTEAPDTTSAPTTTAAPLPEPTRLAIDRLGVDAPVEAKGVAANGDMDVPDNVTDVAWYRFGPAPGEAGSSVLAAHVDLAGQGPGVFFDLGRLEPGDLVAVEYADGSERQFRVAARAVYDKTEIPLDVIFAEDGPPTLTMITCGGGFNRQLRRYDSNVVVYAVPADGPADASGASRGDAEAG